jgi:hydrogenase nickel incorporation protein HypB
MSCGNIMTRLYSKSPAELNAEAARANRKDLDASRTTAITIFGPAGSGKTSIIENLMLRLSPPLRSAVIICNLAADRQVSSITRHGYQAVAVKTDRASAIHVRDAMSQFDLRGLDLLLIEADSSARDPAELDFGQSFCVGAFSAAGGDDKVNEFPVLVASSNLVLLTKVDLLPFVKFDRRAFSDDIARIKPNLPILPLSVQSGEGVNQWLEWIKTHQTETVANHSVSGVLNPFVGISE